jgi:ketosteroid isomerase-like protein
MAEHPNVARIREGYEAFGTGDLEKIGEFFDPNVAWHVGGQSSLAGDYKGHEEVFGLFVRAFEATGGSMKIEVHDVLANDKHGVALVTRMAERDGRSFEMNEVHIFHLSDGKATEYWGFEEDQRRSDEFFS